MSAEAKVGVRVQADTSTPMGAGEVVDRIGKLSDEIDRCRDRLAELVNERNDAIREAIDVYGVSHRRAARYAGLAVGRVHDILANN